MAGLFDFDWQGALTTFARMNPQVRQEMDARERQYTLDQERRREADRQMQLQLRQQTMLEQRAQQEAAERERADQQRRAFLGSIDPNAGPALPFSPAAALSAGLSPQEAQMLAPKPVQRPTPQIVTPNAVIRDPDTGQILFMNTPEARASMGGRPAAPSVEAAVPAPLRQRTTARPQPVAPTQMPDTGAPLPAASQIASDLGVPINPRTPWQTQDPKAAAVTQRQVRSSATKKLDEMDESVRAARQIANDVQRFLQLQTTETLQGPVMGRVPALTASAQEMDAITSKITPQMRQPGSGATSDFDARMFRESTVSRNKSDEANTAIAQGIMLQTQNTEDRAQFMKDYLEANGHLEGADRYWKQYLDKNPIFDPQSKEPRLNSGRMSYRDFFRGVQPSGGYDADKERRYQEWKAKQGAR